MSLFDPQGLYIHHQPSTRKGQVMTKKPVSREGTISVNEYPRALKVLKSLDILSYHRVYRNDLSYYSFSPGFISFTYNYDPEFGFRRIYFRQLWSQIRGSFYNFLSQVPSNYLDDFLFTLGITFIHIEIHNPTSADWRLTVRNMDDGWLQYQSFSTDFSSADGDDYLYVIPYNARSCFSQTSTESGITAYLNVPTVPYLGSFVNTSLEFYNYLSAHKASDIPQYDVEDFEILTIDDINIPQSFAADSFVKVSFGYNATITGVASPL